jgi:hypothetical protein
VFVFKKLAHIVQRSTHNKEIHITTESKK